MKADFSGYATKANLRCSDGRVILPDAFAHMHGEKVPLVWQHTHSEPANVLGHIVLEARDGDVYGHGYFNQSDAAKSARQLVQHGDITALSIYANRLVEMDKMVKHGQIREVSLVLSGANPGALIDNVNIAHSDGTISTVEEEAIIYTGLPLTLIHEEAQEEAPKEEESEMSDTGTDPTIEEIFHTMTEDQQDAVRFLVGEALTEGANSQESISHATAAPASKAPASKTPASDDAEEVDDDTTVKEIFDSMTEDQKNVVYFMIGQALEDAGAGETAQQSAISSEGNSAMGYNVFEMSGNDAGQTPTLSHADAAAIFEGAKRMGSIKEAVDEYALQHGIDDIDTLFPDAKAVTNTPEFEKRRSEWVTDVLSSTRHTPFSRIKSLTANLTIEEARAKGYIKGNVKREEFFRVAKRVTTPQTIYKKQKLDRDDVLDITDFDVVVWLKSEMRLMLDEEIARAVLVGDGRSAGEDDKIAEDHVRSIANDDDLYVTSIYVNLGDANSSAEEIVDALTLQRRHYRGSGNPTFYTSETILSKLLLIKDSLGRRIYSTVADLAAALRVSKIVAVEVMDEPSVTTVGIVANLQDYTIGADRGGDVSLFDDFDIDYNQYKYLIETRISGALTKPKSALVVKGTAASAQLVTPVAPTWDGATHKVTVATTPNVTYKNKVTNATLTTAAPVTLTEDDELTVIAVPSAGYYLASSATDEWLFDYEEGPSGPF